MPHGLADDTPLVVRPADVSFDEEGVPIGVDDGDRLPGVPGTLDDGDGVDAIRGDPVGDVVGVVADIGELAGVGAGGEVVVDNGELAEGEIEGDVELLDGYGDSGDGVIPLSEGVCADDGEDDGEEVFGGGLM
jgi:hypothetical protein